MRHDAFGYHALAWVLQANGRSGEALGAMDTARVTGIEHARMLDVATSRWILSTAS